MDDNTCLVIYYHQYKDANHFVMKRETITKVDGHDEYVPDPLFHFESSDREDLRLFARTSGYSSEGGTIVGAAGIDFELWTIPGELKF